jgi:hypothetical protein
MLLWLGGSTKKRKKGGEGLAYRSSLGPSPEPQQKKQKSKNKQKRKESWVCCVHLAEALVSCFCLGPFGLCFGVLIYAWFGCPFWLQPRPFVSAEDCLTLAVLHTHKGCSWAHTLPSAAAFSSVNDPTGALG